MKPSFFLIKAVGKIKEFLSTKLGTFWLKFRMSLYGIKFGENIISKNSSAQLSVKAGSHCTIGKNVTFNNFHNTGWFCKCKLVIEQGADLSIGDGTGLNGALIVCYDKICIGKYVSIGGGTRIYDTNFHNLSWMERRDSKLNGIAKTAPVVIEDDVFIGTGCIIGKGVTIGARTTIAAGSVVVKSIPADCIAGGNPCKIIKQLEQVQ